MSAIPFKNQYQSLGNIFYNKTTPLPVVSPTLIKFNDELASELGILADPLNSGELAEIFSGNKIPDGAEPLAMVYAGHQFGQFNPQLGDGRAILLGEVRGRHNKYYSIQLKGSGRTVYSRDGDGRSALGPVLREYLVSEAMAKLNVPSTRALAAVLTGEQVVREKLLPGGIITRVASSFVRVGTFEYFAAREDLDSVRQLADFVINRNYPHFEGKDKYASFLQAVVKRQARLIAQWMQIGFIHGVMNTDNMSIAGETIDYGPCAFMDHFNSNQVYSYIDHYGRYAYNNQPSIALWNLTRLAESILPLLSDDTNTAVEVAQDILNSYVKIYEESWLDGMRNKCGLTPVQGVEHDDKALIESLLILMDENQADFTLTFYNLSQLNFRDAKQDNNCRTLFENPAQFDAWAIKWRERMSQDVIDDEERRSKMLLVNPVYIPRNHQIEAAIRAAEDNRDFSVFHALHEVLQNPFTYQAGKDNYMLPPRAEEVVKNTFCGT